MKYMIIVLAVFLLSATLSAQKSVYNLQIEASNGEKIKISTFQGRKIIVAMVSIAQLQTKSLKFLDSLQKYHPDVKIITIPVSTNDTADAEKVRNLVEVADSKVSVSKPLRVKKSDGQEQDSLMRWLTNVSENSHFNEEIHTDEQLYFISAYGVLYAVLEKGAPRELITELLAQPDIKE